MDCIWPIVLMALKWTALNDGKSYLTPTIGNDKLMRDPFIPSGKRWPVSYGLDQWLVGSGE